MHTKQCSDLLLPSVTFYILQTRKCVQSGLSGPINYKFSMSHFCSCCQFQAATSTYYYASWCTR